MKKMRKIISLIVALAFLFSLAAPAMAAEPTAAEKAGNRLLGLGVIEGYVGGGLGLDKNITRAEIAVILAKSSGLAAAADLLKDTPSKFSDVKAGEWYTGWVNLAAAQGWVKGDPQGTFRPNDPVSYREIVTVVMKMLGYNDNLPGDWPVDYLVKAAALKITDGVSFDAKAPAVRGDVFRFTATALEKKVVTYDKDNDSFTEGSKSLMEDKLEVKVIKGRVTDVPSLLGSSLKDDKISIAGQADYDTVVEGFDVSSYIGLEVEFYANDDKDVFAVKSTDADKIVSDKVDGGFSVSGSTYQVTLKDAEDTYSIPGDAVIIKDYAKIARADISDGDYNGASVKLIADSDDVVKYIEIIDWDNADRGIVDEVDGKEISYKNSAGSVTVDYDDEDYDIIVKGAVDSFDKITENDIVYDFNSGNDFILYVVRNTVSGQVTKVNNSGSEIYVDGKKYNASVDFKSKNSGKDFDATNALTDYLGKNAVAYLNPQGEIIAISAGVEASNATTAIALTDLTKESSLGTTTYWVKLFTAEGTKAVYKLEDGDVKVGGTKAKDLTYTDGKYTLKGELVGYDLNQDGKITSLSTKTALRTGYTIDITDNDPVEKYNRLQTVAGDVYYVTSDTVVINSDSANNYDSPSIETWAKVIDSPADITNAKFYGTASNSKVTYIVLEQSVTQDSADDYVVFVSDFYNVDNKASISVFEGGKVVDYVYESYTFTGLAKKDILTYELKNGKIDTATEITPASGVISAVNSDLKLITVGGSVYQADADTVYVDYSDTTAKASSFSGMKKGYTVKVVVDGDNIIKLIMITAK